MTGPPPAAAGPGYDDGYDLTLFVSGASDLSARAIASARQLCDLHLTGRCRLTVIDIHDEPEVALSSQIHAVPTLLRSRPLPVRRLVGDLSQTEHVLSVLLADPGGAAEPRA